MKMEQIETPKAYPLRDLNDMKMNEIIFHEIAERIEANSLASTITSKLLEI